MDSSKNEVNVWPQKKGGGVTGPAMSRLAQLLNICVIPLKETFNVLI